MLGIQEHVEIITQTAVITEKDQENQEDEDSQEDLSVNEDETRPKLFGFNNFIASNCFIIYHCLKHILLVGEIAKKHCMFLSMYLGTTGRRLSDDDPQGWDLVHLDGNGTSILIFCSHKTTEPADLRPWKWWFFKDKDYPPKICNFFPDVGGWYKILEVSQVVYVSDSGSGFFAVCVLYIYLEPKWPAFWIIDP